MQPHDVQPWRGLRCSPRVLGDRGQAHLLGSTALRKRLKPRLNEIKDGAATAATGGGYWTLHTRVPGRKTTRRFHKSALDGYVILVPRSGTTSWPRRGLGAASGGPLRGRHKFVPAFRHLREFGVACEHEDLMCTPSGIQDSLWHLYGVDPDDRDEYGTRARTLAMANLTTSSVIMALRQNLPVPQPGGLQALPRARRAGARRICSQLGRFGIGTLSSPLRRHSPEIGARPRVRWAFSTP